MADIIPFPTPPRVPPGISIVAIGDVHGHRDLLDPILRQVEARAAVRPERRHIVIMFHQRTADIDIVMSNDAYNERYNRDNPNIAIIHALKQAGVDIRVCGQGLIGRKIESKQVNPDVQIDLWAMTTLVNLQLKGFVRVG